MKRAGSVLRLEYGEELHAQLGEYARREKLQGAWLTGLGGTAKVVLGFYDLPTKQYQWKTFETPMEIASLTGNLSIVDGEPFWHVHGVFSRADFQTVGGHVKELAVGPTCELHITPLDSPVTRSYDETIGLKLIDPAK